MSVSRARIDGLLLLGCGVLVARLLLTGQVHLFVGHVVVVLLWIAAPVLLAGGLWQVLRPVGAHHVPGRQDGTASHDATHDATGHHDGTASRGATASHDLTGHHHGAGWVHALVVLPVAVGLAVPLRPLEMIGTTARPQATRTQAAGRPATTTSSGQLPSAPASVRPVAIDPRTGQTVGGYDNGGDNVDGSQRNGPMGPPPDHWPALGGSPASLDVYDYVARASDPAGAATLKGRTVSLVGFVSADPDNPSGPWVVARLKMWCCVADALPFMVTAVGAPSRPAGGSWVRITGHYLPSLANGDARLQVDQVVAVDAPRDPYL